MPKILNSKPTTSTANWICAPATPFETRSALTVIRASGSSHSKASIFSAIHDAVQVVGVPSHSSPAPAVLPPLAWKARHSYYISLKDDKGTVDDVLFTAYYAPHSYTGEDSFEISCHGNPLIVKRILALLLKRGFRLAKPGEFTERAYLNGKLDLNAAQAVAEIIEAKSHNALDAAKRLAHGSFRSEMLSLRSQLMNLLADLNAELDFIDEDISFTSHETKLALLKEVEYAALQLKTTTERYHQIKDGVRVAIVGLPNAGKSSLMNRLVGHDRTIVSDIAGTTRDYIEAELEIEGVNIRLFDTAGLRENSIDPIEQMGIERTRELVANAHICLYLRDASSEKTGADVWESLGVQTKALIIPVLNKVDILHPSWKDAAEDESTLKLSIATGAGMDDLLKKMGEAIRTLTPKDALPLALWQVETLDRIAKICLETQEALKERELPEVVTHLVGEAVRAIAEITGEISNDAILGRIFSRFCVGK